MPASSSGRMATCNASARSIMRQASISIWSSTLSSGASVRRQPRPRVRPATAGPVARAAGLRLACVRWPPAHHGRPALLSPGQFATSGQRRDKQQRCSDQQRAAPPARRSKRWRTWPAKSRGSMVPRNSRSDACSSFRRCSSFMVSSDRASHLVGILRSDVSSSLRARDSRCSTAPRVTRSTPATSSIVSSSR